MPKFARYLLIFVGVTAFSILAPILILYSAGMKYDFEKNQMIKTGILALRYEPDDATVYLDGQKQKNGIQTLRFLNPGDHQLRINAPGFCAWQKNLSVAESQVTWASPADNKIRLIRSHPQTLDLPEKNIQDFVFLNNQITILEPRAISTYKPEGMLIKKIELPLQTKGVLMPTGRANEFLIYAPNEPAKKLTFLLVDTASGAITELTGLFADMPKSVFEFQGQIMVLKNNSLFRLDPVLRQKLLFQKDVMDAKTVGNELYLLKSTPLKTQVFLADNLDINSSNLLLEISMVFQTANLEINSQKQIFLQADNQLFRLSPKPEKVTEVQEIYLGENYPMELVYFGEGEVTRYNLANGTADLITRTEAKLKNLRPVFSIGQIFWIKDEQNLVSLELDSRDIQNECLVYSGSNLAKFEIDETLKKVFLLDDGLVKILNYF